MEITQKISITQICIVFFNLAGVITENSRSKYTFCLKMATKLKKILIP